MSQRLRSFPPQSELPQTPNSYNPRRTEGIPTAYPPQYQLPPPSQSWTQKKVSLPVVLFIVPAAMFVGGLAYYAYSKYQESNPPK